MTVKAAGVRVREIETVSDGYQFWLRYRKMTISLVSTAGHGKILMATNDFKPFATGSGANVLSGLIMKRYLHWHQGFFPAKPRQHKVNKALRQSSTIAAVLAQFMADSTGSDVTDNGNIATLLNILKSALNNQAEGRLLPHSGFLPLAEHG